MMRRLIGLAAAALLIVGCSGPAATDPYALVDKSFDASYDLVQVNVGISGTSAGTTISVDPQDIQLIADTKTGKVAFKLALPLAALGADAAAVRQFGVTGDVLAIDLVYDGAGLYAKGPVLTTLLTALMVQAGQVPSDLSGWIRLGTKEEFAALAGQLGAGARPSAVPAASHDAASIKKSMEDAGVTLTYAGSASHNGVDSEHLTAAIDPAKLRANPAFNSLTGTQLQELEGALNNADLSADIWVEKGSSRLAEVDIHVAAKGGSGDKTDVTVRISQPSDTSALTAPATFTEVSLTPILQMLLQSFGQGLFTP